MVGVAGNTFKSLGVASLTRTNFHIERERRQLSLILGIEIKRCVQIERKDQDTLR